MSKIKSTQLKTILSEVRRHYQDSKAELDTRVGHKLQGFDEYDRLYRSTIPDSGWPFSAKIFIPMAFTSLYSKGSRLITGKVKGRLIATQYGDELGARIGTELLSTQYDDLNEYDDETMVSKWLRMDQNARKYGAGFGLVQWRRESKDGKICFDGPTFSVLDNRKVFTQPGTYSISDADYVIVEREVSVKSLKDANEAAKVRGEEPVYQNLDLLEKSGIKGSSEFTSINKSVRGLNNEPTHDTGEFRRVRILTEYRKDYWITWCPDAHSETEEPGLILKAVPNPHKHKLIPVIRLVYMPLDDDLYGVSELEPSYGVQKAMNALTSGFIESVSTSLYPIIKGNPVNVDWNSIEFKPRALWIMQNPSTDIVPFQSGTTFISTFAEAYRLLQATFAQSMGDTTAEGSQLAQLGSNDKTATEIRDLALQRGSRDNLNKLFLSSAMEKMFQMWWSMDQQYLRDEKVIRLVGKEALEYFTNQQLNGYTLDDDGYQVIASYMQENPGVSYAEAYNTLLDEGTLEQYSKPIYPTSKGLPKLQVNEDQKSGFLSVLYDDLIGQYRFSLDLNSLGQPNDAQEVQAINQFITQTSQMKEDLAAQGYRVKYKDLLETQADKLKIHNADSFFERLPEQITQSQGQQLPIGQLPLQTADQPMGVMNG